ncbi:uncharacterized protein LOC118225979 isoform X3 [Anguilla anguilla]|uniref:uncharacterized protein LOC118225979 isoform X3 n=1 Tax=Anguilla anguilla TaxID=7936 RepID=UPI0015A896B4|nr:uncharacterized protein LOC118225979 isoform X3 [Anguilla anguilla]
METWRQRPINTVLTCSAANRFDRERQNCDVCRKKSGSPKLPQKPKAGGGTETGFSSLQVYQSLSEVVAEALEDDLTHYITHFLTRNKEGQPGKTSERNRAIQITVEHIILETTMELATEVAHALFNIRSMCRALAFDLILSSVQVAGGSPGEDDSALTHMILQQLQTHRDLNYRPTEN